MKPKTPILILILLAAPFLSLSTARSETVDRIVASVGRQAITLSDIEREDRLACFFEGRLLTVPDTSHIREVAMRLVDQWLIRQEMEAGNFPIAVPELIEPQLEGLRRRPDYQELLVRCGIKEDALRLRLVFQAELLDFIDFRVRPGLQVSSEEIERYYKQEFLPEAAKRGEKAAAIGGGQPPPLNDDVREKISAILMDRQVNQRLASWIVELRAQRPVRIR